MKGIRTWSVPLAIPALAIALGAQGRIGERLQPSSLEGFANTEARSFEDFTGRAVLLEFFAYW